eukprot:TRINITY_DN5083_c0_g1_i1.p2 TRINITY_DN5083_c0_g1~~TRINITY_DN5083_c0_g1_i1.p2  ORF type:complete len:135 (+),score=45.07 TRINITY_DN5083_c0_g1_i1:548-952(+)
MSARLSITCLLLAIAVSFVMLSVSASAARVVSSSASSSVSSRDEARKVLADRIMNAIDEYLDAVHEASLLAEHHDDEDAEFYSNLSDDVMPYEDSSFKKEYKPSCTGSGCGGPDTTQGAGSRNTGKKKKTTKKF